MRVKPEGGDGQDEDASLETQLMQCSVLQPKGEAHVDAFPVIVQLFLRPQPFTLTIKNTSRVNHMTS